MGTLQRLRRLLAQLLRIEESAIQPGSVIGELFERAGGDSLDLVEFIMAVEEQFPALEIPKAHAAEWEDIRRLTVQQLANLIDRRQQP